MLTLAFSQTTLKEMLHNYNLARGLHCHSRFDDLDFVSSHRHVRNIYCKLVGLDFCPL